MSTNYISQITATDGVTYDIQEGVTTRIFRATCTTSASTAAKVATLDDDTGYSLTAGVRVAVTFKYGNTATYPTLNVNSGGAKYIYYKTAASSAQNVNELCVWGANETVIFTYDGSSWTMMGSSLALYNAYNKAASSGSGTITEVKTNAGAHTTIDVLSGKAEFNVPTKTSHLTNDSGFITSSSLNNYLEKSYTGSNQTGSISWNTYDNNNIYLFTQVDNTNEDAHSYIGIDSYSIGLGTTNNSNEDSFTGEVTVSSESVDIGFSNDAGVGDTSYYLTIDKYNGYHFRSINNHDYYHIYMPQNKSGTVALTSDVPTITLNGASTTSPSFYAPTTAGTSSYVLKSNGSGAAPTWVSAALTDTKLSVEDLKTNYDSSSTYNVVLRGSGTGASTGYISNIYFSHVGGSTSSQGYAHLKLGNETATGTNGNSTGRLTLYASNNRYTQINTNTLTNNNVITLPSSTGTLALTSDIPTVPTITLNGSSTTSPSFYAPTNAGTSGYYLKSNGSGAPTWAAFPTIPTDEKVKQTTDNNSNNRRFLLSNSSSTEETASVYKSDYFLAIGDTLYFKNANNRQATADAEGFAVFAANTAYYSCLYNDVLRFKPNSYSVDIGVTTPTSSRTINFPNASGTVALTSDIPAVPTITLNGSATTSPSFYAPTTAGTSGQFLKSSGSGAPSWSALAATDIPTLAQTKISANSASIEFDYTGDSYTTNSLSDVTNALIDEIDATQTAMENITAMVNSKPNIKITRW